MPFSPRQKGSRKSPRAGDEEYVVFLQGIPPQCRWQELKDLVRQTAHHIRQAVVYDDCHGRPTGLGQIIVKNEDEAWRTYNRLSTNGWDGHSLTVTLSLARAPTKPIAGPSKSQPAMRRYPSYARGYPSSPNRTPNMSTPSSSASPEKHVFTSQPYQWLPEYYPYIPNLAPGYQPLGHDTNNSIAYVPLVFNNKGPVTLPTPPAHPSEFETYARPIFPYAVPNTQSLHHAHWNNINDLPAQNYSISQVHSCDSSNSSDRSNRSSISTASGTSIQQSRSVLVQKLKPNATWQNLREYLRSAGVVERCEVYNNRRSGQNGTAKATFRSTEEAQKAVSLFDNSCFWGSRIRVTLGEESSGSGLANGYNSGKNNDVVHAEHELLTGSMGNMAINTVDEDKMSKPKEPLVVNGSSVGAKTSISSQGGVDYPPASHIVQNPQAI